MQLGEGSARERGLGHLGWLPLPRTGNGATLQYLASVKRNPKLDPLRQPLDGKRKTAVLNRLKTARGHLDSVVGQIDGDAYMIDVLRQLAAVRGAIDATIRLALRHYFEHAFVGSVKAGHSEAAIDELMNALTFLREVQ